VSIDRRSRGRLVCLPNCLLLGALEALLATQVAAVVEHVVRVGMQRPVATFTWSIGATRHLDEAVVERQTVSDRVLPALLGVAVERELIHNELVDLA